MRRTLTALALLSTALLVGLSQAHAGEILPMEYPCSDFLDNDGDGLVDYPADPGCFAEWDLKEDNGPEAYQLEPETFEFGPEEFEITSTTLTLTDVRCKRQTFTAAWKQVGLVTVLKYAGEFRVCYRPGQSIVSWGNMHGDATYTVVPWEWRGNDSGYPYGTKVATDTIQFHYRGSAAVCILFKGCGPEKHPWVRITFYADNTLSKTWGVA